MKGQILATIIALSTSSSGHAKSLVCTKFGLRNSDLKVAELKVNYLENEQIQVSLEYLNTAKLTGHLVREEFTSSNSTYILLGDNDAKGTLEVKTILPSSRNICPRCTVDPTFIYTAVLNLGGTIYSFPSTLYSYCRMED